MDKNDVAKRENLISRIKARKMEHLKTNPHGTSMNGYTKNTPISLDNHELKKRERTLRERKRLNQERRRKTLKIKKAPLPVNQMEEFLGMKPVQSYGRDWNLDEAEFLRFQSSARHSADDVKRTSSPVSMYQLRVDNNENHFYKRLMKNMSKGPAPRFTGRYEGVTENKPKPKHVRSGSHKSGPRSMGRYENPSTQHPTPTQHPSSVKKSTTRPSAVRNSTKKKILPVLPVKKVLNEI
jgi:hypothetical protein